MKNLIQSIKNLQLKFSVCTLGLVFVFLISSANKTDSASTRIEIGNLILEGVPTISQEIKDKFAQYSNIRGASFTDWGPNGEGILITTRFGETSQIHLVEKPGGARKQITFFNEPVYGANMSPNESLNSFLFSKDVGGGENYQIFHYNFEENKYQMITDGNSRNGSSRWSNEGNKFVYRSNKRNGRDNDLYIVEVANPKNERMVFEAKGSWSAGDWSPDDKYLLISNYKSINESYYYVLNVETGAVDQVNQSEKEISYGAAKFSKDGKGIYYVSDEDEEFRKLRYYDLKTKKSEILAKDIAWNVGRIELSQDGSKMLFSVNEDGLGKIYLMDTKTRSIKKLAGLPVGQLFGFTFHQDGNRIALNINSPQSPSDAYIYYLDTEDIERWTFSEVGGLNTDEFVIPELVHFTSFDNTEIPAFYYKPKKSDKKSPVLVHIHGGPESQYRPYFNSMMQYLVKENNIAVIAPNVRGSAGYGKSYLKLDNGFKRENSVKDIGALLDWIAQQPELDANRVAVSGGSYGGYMSLACMTHFNDRFKVGIDFVGISNFVTFLKNTKSYRRDLRRAEYGDERDPEMNEFLQKISPSNNVQKITKPMFIVQGLNDPRVPVGEAEQIVDALKKNNNEVWYLLAKDEGHGFKKKKNRDYYHHAFIMFLEKYL
ncbi:MAG: peptidase S9, prolyl oligopeptidase [Bacteroidetes bacterium]|nr:MAG: peptidase S9, prolyl oligopeptidase [Bacteroidota bacterium]